MTRYQKLLLATEAEVGKVTVVLHLDSWLISFVHWFLKLLTRKKTFSSFTTTIGRRMYVPNGWNLWSDDDKYVLLMHEREHMFQFRRWPMRFLDMPLLWVINAVIFSFCYLLVLPTRWTMRAGFERAGYKATLRANITLGRLDVRSEAQTQRWVDHLEETFSGPAYWKMAKPGYATDFAQALFAWELERLKTFERDEREWEQEKNV